MTGKFFLAAIPEPHTVLGLRLKPFCAGHIILLHRTENAVVTGGTIDEAQLSAAVFYCANTYEDGVASLDTKKTHEFFEEWGKKIGDFSLPEKLARFSDYIKAGSTIPTYSSKLDGTGTALQLPLVQIVKCALLKAFGGMTESEFLNRPWGLSLWDFITIRGLEGAVDVFECNVVENAQSVADALAAKFGGKCPV